MLKLADRLRTNKEKIYGVLMLVLGRCFGSLSLGPLGRAQEQIIHNP